MIRLINILHTAEEIASKNSFLFSYDNIKKWYSICDTLKQVSTKTNTYNYYFSNISMR
jgi:hypothetical protein